MRPIEDVEKLVEKFTIRTNDKQNELVFGKLVKEFEKSRKTNTALFEQVLGELS